MLVNPLEISKLQYYFTFKDWFRLKNTHLEIELLRYLVIFWSWT